MKKNSFSLKIKRESINQAIEDGDIDTIIFLIDNGLKPDEDMLWESLYWAQKDIVVILLDEGVPVTEQMLDKIIPAAPYEIIELLKEGLKERQMKEN